MIRRWKLSKAATSETTNCEVAAFGANSFKGVRKKDNEDKVAVVMHAYEVKGSESVSEMSTGKSVGTKTTSDEQQNVLLSKNLGNLV